MPPHVVIYVSKHHHFSLSIFFHFSGKFLHEIMVGMKLQIKKKYVRQLQRDLQYQPIKTSNKLVSSTEYKSRLNRTALTLSGEESEILRSLIFFRNHFWLMKIHLQGMELQNLVKVLIWEEFQTMRDEDLRWHYVFYPEYDF